MYQFHGQIAQFKGPNFARVVANDLRKDDIGNHTFFRYSFQVGGGFFIFTIFYDLYLVYYDFLSNNLMQQLKHKKHTNKNTTMIRTPIQTMITRAIQSVSDKKDHQSVGSYGNTVDLQGITVGF